MPLETGDREWVQREIRKAQAEALRRRGLPWLRDWVLVVAGGVVVVGAIIATSVMTNFAMKARRQVADSQSINEERAANMDRELESLATQISTISAANEAAKPGFADRLTDLLEQTVKRAEQNLDPVVASHTATALTRKARELSIQSDPVHIAQVGRGFLRLMKVERLRMPLMQAVQELIGYRSTLVPNPFGEPDRSAIAHSAMLVLPQFQSFVPLTSKSAIYGYDKVDTASGIAKLNVLDRPEPILSGPFQGVMVDGYEVVLDGLGAQNVVFSGCRIHYDGGKANLENVYFKDCTFTINQAGIDFARVALEDSPAVLLNKR